MHSRSHRDGTSTLERDATSSTYAVPTCQDYNEYSVLRWWCKTVAATAARPQLRKRMCLSVHARAFAPPIPSPMGIFSCHTVGCAELQRRPVGDTERERPAVTCAAAELVSPAALSLARVLAGAKVIVCYSLGLALEYRGTRGVNINLHGGFHGHQRQSMANMITSYSARPGGVRKAAQARQLRCVGVIPLAPFANVHLPSGSPSPRANPAAQVKAMGPCICR